MNTLIRLKYTIIAIEVIAATGCAVDTFTGTGTTPAENPDYEIIRSLGLSTDDIIETEDSYVVEGDIVFEKKSMQDYAGKTGQLYYRLSFC